MFSLTEPPFFTRLRDARRILVAGAGGGFDVYAGLPPALALRSAGKEVHLANLSIADLYGLDTDVWLEVDVAAVGPDTAARGDCFPERALARWLAGQGLPRHGVRVPADRGPAVARRVSRARRPPRRRGRGGTGGRRDRHPHAG